MFRFDIRSLRSLRGPNRYSRCKSVFLLLDISEYKSKSTALIQNFANKLIDCLPSLVDDTNSNSDKKEFLIRLKNGTNIADVILYIALELQTLAGFPMQSGKVVETKEHGVYVIVFDYIEEHVGEDSAEEAVNLIESIINKTEYQVDDVILDLKDTNDVHRFNFTTHALIDEAAKRDIPYIRLNKSNYVQLGYGRYQQKIDSSMTSKTSALAVDLVEEKSRINNLLKESCIPVPEWVVATSFIEARNAAESLSFPIVVKPEIGRYSSRGITVNINDVAELKTAYISAVEVNENVIVEEHLEGNIYRLLVIAGKFEAASLREPPYIIGDGKHTIQELTDQINSNPFHLGSSYENGLSKIKLDGSAIQIMKSNNLEIETILQTDHKLYLKTTADLSEWGIATDVTNIIHPEIRIMAERTAMVVGMNIMGIDFICKDISKSLITQKTGIIDVNAEPNIRMHVCPDSGMSRNVAKPIIDLLFPPEAKALIPIIAVTGTNGKTTVCKLIAHSLKYSGKKVGLTGTTGVEIDGTSIVNGDYSGPSGHELVLRDATVDCAVLETARGAILRRGLIYESCDIGVFLNVGEDHIGNDLIESVEDLGDVKATVVKSVKDSGFSILNADDEIVMKHKNEAGGQCILFSLDSENKYVTRHITEGGTSVLVLDDKIIIRTKEYDIIISDIIDVPMTFHGTADFNISNSLAAVGALHGLGLKREQIQGGITTFYPSITLNPGRMNIFDFNRFKVILDYGHNKHAMDALSKMLPKLSTGRKIGICHGSGNRTDELLKEFAAIMAKAYDHIIITDLDTRQRKLGETAEVVHQGILDTGFDENSVEIILDVHEAIDHAFNTVEDGDIIVIQVDKIQPVIDQILRKKNNDIISPCSF